jgi:hypothetical protein
MMYPPVCFPAFEPDATHPAEPVSLAVISSTEGTNHRNPLIFFRPRGLTHKAAEQQLSIKMMPEPFRLSAPA